MNIRFEALLGSHPDYAEVYRRLPMSSDSIAKETGIALNRVIHIRMRLIDVLANPAA